MASDKPSGSLQTVKFNVGGKSFETSVSLIDQHKDTMLSRLVSKTWQQDPNKSVFIDRDGDVFAQVLNYLRYGSITLPGNIAKDMFLRDLDFYGIVPEEGSVRSASEGWASNVDKRYNEINDHEDQLKQLKLENEIDFLANYCAGKYVSPGAANERGSVKIFQPGKNYDKDKEILWNAVQKVYDKWGFVGDNEEVLSKALMKYGLSLSEDEGVKYHSKSSCHSYYTVTVQSSK